MFLFILWRDRSNVSTLMLSSFSLRVARHSLLGNKLNEQWGISRHWSISIFLPIEIVLLWKCKYYFIYWGYIVTFIKVLIILHSWIHTLYHSPLSPFPTFLEYFQHVPYVRQWQYKEFENTMALNLSVSRKSNSDRTPAAHPLQACGCRQ
jgi:hypothetical protein